VPVYPGFLLFVRTGPYLNARLKRVGREARIIDIAFDLGFTHLGRMRAPVAPNTARRRRRSYDSCTKRVALTYLTR
jgi:hypothetical protein